MVRQLPTVVPTAQYMHRYGVSACMHAFSLTSGLLIASLLARSPGSSACRMLLCPCCCYLLASCAAFIAFVKPVYCKHTCLLAGDCSVLAVLQHQRIHIHFICVHHLESHCCVCPAPPATG